MIAPDLPFIDLHRHLEGNVRVETAFELRQKHGLPLPAGTPEEFRSYVQVSGPQPGLLAFFEKFDWSVGSLADYDACYRVAYENVQDAQREGLDYLELRFSPRYMALPHGLSAAGVTEAVAAGVAAGVRDTGIPVSLIGILSRTYGPAACTEELEALLTQPDRITALDLAGDEIHFPAALFVEHFKRGRDAGWRITVHAGEAAGPESVWQALRLLGAERIGHGVHSTSDPALMDHLVGQRIPLEMSLTSNIQTSTFAGYAAHPIRQFVGAGAVVTLNSDDPGTSSIDLRHEYELAAPAAGLSPSEIRQLQQNALEAAFLPAAAKEQLRTRCRERQ